MPGLTLREAVATGERAYKVLSAEQVVYAGDVLEAMRLLRVRRDSTGNWVLLVSSVFTLDAEPLGMVMPLATIEAMWGADGWERTVPTIVDAIQHVRQARQLGVRSLNVNLHPGADPPDHFVERLTSWVKAALATGYHVGECALTFEADPSSPFDRSRSRPRSPRSAD